MDMTPENIEEWLRVSKDLSTADSDHIMAWYILNDKDQVVPTDYHEWREWNQTRNLAGNPDSPQAVIFLASITDVMMGS